MLDLLPINMNILLVENMEVPRIHTTPRLKVNYTLQVYKKEPLGSNVQYAYINAKL